MYAILHKESGKSLRVGVQLREGMSKAEAGKAVTQAMNEAGMLDRVLWSEVHL